MKISLSIQIILLLALNFLFALSAQSKTYHPVVDEPIQELAYRCAEAEECTPKLEEEIVFLEEGDIYLNKENEEVDVIEEGFLVVDRFVALKKTRTSPDGNFYSCDNSTEIVFEGTNMTEIKATGDKDVWDYILSSFKEPCATLWAPKQVLRDLKPAAPLDYAETTTEILGPPGKNTTFTSTLTPNNNASCIRNCGYTPILIFNPPRRNPFEPPHVVPPTYEPPVVEPSPVPIGGELGLFGFLYPWNWF